MNTRHFVVPAKDLDLGPKRLSLILDQAFLDPALEGTEATYREPGRAEVELFKNDDDVIVRGHAEATVTMPCSRTLEPIPVRLECDVFLQLCARHGIHGRPGEHVPGGRRAARERAEATARGRQAAKANPVLAERERPKSTGPGKPRRFGTGGDGVQGWAADPTLGDEDAAQDSYNGEEIVLDPFLREFLLLEIPMQVFREDLKSDPLETNAPVSSGSKASTSPLSTDAAAAEQTPADRSGAHLLSEPASIDPRLAPLAELARRLREKKE